MLSRSISWEEAAPIDASAYRAEARSVVVLIAHRVAAQLRCGMVWINTWLMRDLRTPFGGTGQSGLGREGGMEAMRFFTEPRTASEMTTPPDDASACRRAAMLAPSP